MHSDTGGSDGFPSSPPRIASSKSYRPSSEAGCEDEDDDAHLDREQCEAVTQNMLLAFLESPLPSDCCGYPQSCHLRTAFCFRFRVSSRPFWSTVLTMKRQTSSNRFREPSFPSTVDRWWPISRPKVEDARCWKTRSFACEGRIYAPLFGACSAYDCTPSSEANGDVSRQKERIRDQTTIAGILAQQAGELLAAMRERVLFLAQTSQQAPEDIVDALPQHTRTMYLISAEQTKLYFGEMMSEAGWMRPSLW
ncbi:hypothetical protein FN846DRAFT_992232 [Sphaerosporella brunnea]|uniref:Uncharacterized protein n=1 Tax=Sphaerosporella brunnea TaxID=1250544 RepID=A0A5J5EDA7_9PEZI|nr:hypothetical protein FN846DRAFT_896162 [Sphaerosporella brunnea]KAA8897771.1 hypothetical protein FN846DRAFT_992232 [Sphaerosporella brunnea]